ncbi:hypothetical protein HYDPIDRAFT_109198 [Hydnomerulius pinastri MD-312]|nr:hypothetical protein HYDPIDRAFT_109198 [Hydnomerulius pinastri MD-312]
MPKLERHKYCLLSGKWSAGQFCADSPSTHKQTNMKLIITGATGAAGMQIFRQAVNDASVTKITLLSRRALPPWVDLPQTNKTEVIVIPDFLNYPPELPALLAEHDACIWALGTSSVGLTEEQYTRITHDYTLAFANQIKDITKTRVGDPFRLVFISGESADQSEKGRLMFTRIKGRTEKSLLDLPSSFNITTQVLRPGYFFPSNPTDRANTRPSGARTWDSIIAPILKNLLPASYTPIDQLGRFAVELAKGRWGEEIIFKTPKMQELLRGLDH